MNQLQTVPIFVTPSPAGVLADPYARVSIPLIRGAHRGVPGVRVRTDRGAPVAVQSEVLARWPEGSARMLHLTFPARGGVYQASIGGSAKQPAIRNGIRVARRGAKEVRISTGRLTAEIGGPGLVKSIRLGRHEMIGAGGIEFRVTDGAQRGFAATADAGVKTEIETDGPLRTVIALKGRCTLGRETFIHFRLRFEFLAGVEGFSLGCMFYNLERGRDFFDVRSMELELRLAGAAQSRQTVYQQSHGLFSTLGRMVTTAQSLEIVADDVKARAYVRNHAALEDATDYPFYLNPPCDVVDAWAVVSESSRAMQVEMDDFMLMRPKSLVVGGGAARLGIWPAWAEKLELQQGRSREVTVRVALWDRGAPSEQPVAAAAMARLRDVWRAQLPQKAYGDARFFDQSRALPYRPDLNPRFEGWLSNLFGQLNTIATFFDLGDTPDSGYQTTYIPIGNRIRRIRGEDGGRRYFSTGSHYPATKHNCLDDFEVVWVNNEYDVIFAIGTEYLRTADLGLLQKLRWFSRHTIEVDFLHYSDHKWLNRAQPAHSERHTTTGAYPSHFWTQGLAQYYMLTGDRDALDVIIGLADKTIENLEDPVMREVCGGLNREIGWGILTMICAYEASGLKRFDEYARRLLDREIRHGLPDDMPVFSFGFTSILLGARQYLDVHRGEAKAEPVRKWFLDFVDLAVRSATRVPAAPMRNAKDAAYYGQAAGLRGTLPRSGVFGSHSMALDSLAYAHEITGDRGYIDAGMRSLDVFVESPEFRTPVPEGKPTAMVYRTFVNFLKAAADLGLLEEYRYRH